MPSVLKQSNEQRGWVHEKGQPGWAKECGRNVLVPKSRPCRASKNAGLSGTRVQSPTQLLLGHLYVKAPDQDLSQDQSGWEATLPGGKVSDSLPRMSLGGGQQWEET